MKGVKISTTNCGIKYKNRDDLLLITFDKAVNVAGVFTSSSMPAASVVFCKENIKHGKAKALIVNAGNANAFTGKAGEEIVAKTAQAIVKNLGCKKEEIFISSTGVIGEVFDANLITAKIAPMLQNSSEGNEAFERAAKAIMTTDTKMKMAKTTCEIEGKEISLIGFAKGSGMIAPNMATMLSYIFTDANIAADTLQELLREAVNQSFNAITVDSDQSTNDTALLFATGEVGSHEINDSHSKELKEFKSALNEICLSLAKKIVVDGEGAQKLIEVEVEAAVTKDQAKEVAFAIADSPLVKTAIAGADPNWGRIIMAVGKSCPDASPQKIIVKIGDHVLTKEGGKHPEYIEKAVHEYLKNNHEVKISVNLGLGAERFVVWTCDLNEEYIKINKDYRS